jgi:hypothetical protein
MSQPSKDGPADAGFMCDKVAMLGEMKNELVLRQFLREDGY